MKEEKKQNVANKNELIKCGNMSKETFIVASLLLDSWNEARSSSLVSFFLLFLLFSSASSLSFPFM